MLITSKKDSALSRAFPISTTIHQQIATLLGTAYKRDVSRLWTLRIKAITLALLREV